MLFLYFETAKFPYAHIKNWKWTGRTTLELKLHYALTGKIQAILVDPEGKKLRDLVTDKTGNGGSDENFQISLSFDDIRQPLRVLLFHEGNLVHWQELN